MSKFNIGKILETAISEALADAHAEREKQRTTARGVVGTKSNVPVAPKPKKVSEDEKLATAVSDEPQEEVPTEEPAEEEPAAKPAPDDKQAMESADIGPGDVIDKLNTIRSGKSFKDSAVSGAMEKYITSLDDAERTALFTFLKGIAQICTGEFNGDVAVEPADKPANVQMKKEPTTSSRQVKPNVVKGQAPASTGTATGNKPQNPSASAEDTSAPKPSPITPKKRNG